LEDWKKAFHGKIIGVADDKEYELYELLTNRADFVTDSDKIRYLEPGCTRVAILTANGTAILPIDKDRAADMLDNGTAVVALVANDQYIDVNIAQLSIVTIAAKKAYEENRIQRIFIKFDEVTPAPNLPNKPADLYLQDIVIIIDENGVATSPITGMPLHFKVKIKDNPWPISLEELGLEYNSENWLDVVLNKAGAIGIVIYAW